MPIVHIQILQGRSADQVRELIHNVTETVSVTLESPKENVRVLVTEVPKTHWGVAGTPMSDRTIR